MASVQGRTVLITGAGSGLGRRVAHLMAERGARVVAWDIDGGALARLREEVPGLTAHVVDVSSERAVEAAAAQVRAEVGDVDVLVNNAGVVSGRPLLDLTAEEIRRTIGVNLLALFWTTRAFLPAMVRRGDGHVVTIASAAGVVGVARQTDYAASKHAALGFDASLRQELRSVAPGVRTTAISPFFVDTGMFHGARTRVPWLLPILEEERVAAAIVRAVERGRRRVFLPPVVRAVYLAQALPTPLTDAIMRALGVNASMAEFVGREGSAARPSGPAA